MAKHCTQCGEGLEDDARFCAKCGTPVVAVAAAVAPAPSTNGTPPTSPSNDPMVGKVIADRYVLVEKIGGGGSGTIYRGEHNTLRKKVAVKILHSSLSQDEHAVERFRREATTVAEIDNEHILQVIDFGRTDDHRLFFAMEYLEGETLTKVLEREGELGIERVFDIVAQIGEALMDAHGLGYIHRDLRPRNVFLTTKKGRADFVKLLDFGLAKLITPSLEAKQTALGMTFGDPRYMSPEQARGETVDRRADIYSLGIITFEMLTGAPPYLGQNPFDVLQQHLDGPIPSVRKLRQDCPEWLDAIVQRALAKKPGDRFLTTLKMLECLKQRKAPLNADEAERDAHAKLTATAQIKAVGDIFAASAAPSETQALGSRGVAKPVEVPAAALELNAPAMVVDGTSGDRTQPARPALPQGGLVVEEHKTIPLPKAPALPPPPAGPRQKDPTGEWYEESGKFAHHKREQSPDYHDDEDEFAPKKNRAGLIIGGVAGGLTVVGALVILLLPKPAHKPLRGETGAETPAVAAAPAPAPAPVPPQPPPSNVIEHPAPPAAPPVAVAPTPEAKPAPPQPETKPEPVKPEPVKPVAIAAKPEAKPEPKLPPKAEPKPVAAKPAPSPAPKPAAVKPAPTRVAAAEPAPKRNKLPDGFKDPFAGEAKPAPTNAQAEFFVKLGRQKLNASDLAAASNNFNKAREYDPKSPDAYAGLGEVAFEQGDYNTAKVNLLQALRLSPSRPRYLVLLGQTYYKLGRAKDAVGEYRKALKVDPNNAEAQHSLEVAERKLAQQGG